MLLGTDVEAVILAMEDLVLRLAIIGSLPGPGRESSCTASIRLRPSPVSVRRDVYLQTRALLATLTAHSLRATRQGRSSGRRGHRTRPTAYPDVNGVRRPRPRASIELKVHDLASHSPLT